MVPRYTIYEGFTKSLPTFLLFLLTLYFANEVKRPFDSFLNLKEQMKSGFIFSQAEQFVQNIMREEMPKCTMLPIFNKNNVRVLN